MCCRVRGDSGRRFACIAGTWGTSRTTHSGGQSTTPEEPAAQRVVVRSWGSKPRVITINMSSITAYRRYYKIEITSFDAVSRKSAVN